MTREPPLPAHFDDVIGHERAKGVLTAAMRTGRVHHAWVFSGPAGVGKHALATAFAAALLDPEAGVDLTGGFSADPGSVIASLVRRGAHADLHLIDKDLAEFAEDAKERESKRTTIAKWIVERFMLVPMGVAASRAGGLASKVFIVDEAELLDRSPRHAPTQASMLKTLEEPPAGTVIILVTSSEDRLLTTIRSRCQRVLFDPLTDAEMDRWAAAGGLELSEADRSFVLRFAAGAPGLAQRAVETGLARWQAAVTPMLLEVERGVFPLELGTTTAKLINDWATAKVEADETESKAAANHEAAGLMVRLIARWCADGLRAASVGGDEHAIEAWALRIDALRDFEHHESANVNLGIACEQLAIGLGCSAEPA